jgi:hypothetical protein
VPFAGPCSPTDAVSCLAEQRLGRVAMLDFEVSTVAEVCEPLTSGGVIDEARRDPDCSRLAEQDAAIRDTAIMVSNGTEHLR